MDHTLRCNNLTCRAPLSDSAIVTTCSHIFCVNCSSHPSLSPTPPTAPRTCPACKSRLDNPDDAVVTTLNPTEDYKTSVLSGLSPGVVVECAGRGLAFWAYQCTQEIYYQEHVSKSMNGKYQGLKHRHDALEREKEDVIVQLNEQLQAADDEIKQYKKMNQEMQEAVRQIKKDRDQLKSLYHKAKSQQLAPNLAFAAEEDAVNALHGNARGTLDEFDNAGGGGYTLQSRAGSNGSGGKRAGQDRYTLPASNGRAGLQSAQNVPRMPPTPSVHRQHLPQQSGYHRSSHIVSGSGFPGVNNEQPYHATPSRQALGSLDPNMYGGQPGTGYGMPNMKMGRQPGGHVGRSAVQNAQSRTGRPVNMR